MGFTLTDHDFDMVSFEGAYELTPCACEYYTTAVVIVIETANQVMVQSVYTAAKNPKSSRLV